MTVQNKEKNQNLPFVSVVVIGRNEARNLPACIESIREMDYPQDLLEVIYVDTDSVDDSPDIARQYGAKVFEEHSDFPTPGLARNRGWREGKYEIIHFIDGDMMVAPSYLREAVKYLMHNGVVSVIGRLNLSKNSENLISRILHFVWEKKQTGYVSAPGAGGTFSKLALAKVGGYNPELLRGEETDLGYRLRQSGMRIMLIDEVMGTHDYDIRTPLGLWERFYNMGRSFAKILQLKPTESLTCEQRAARRVVFQGIIAMVDGMVLIFLKLWWVLVALPLLLAIYVVVRYWQPTKRRWKRIVYFLLEYFGKPVIWIGMIGYNLKYWKKRIMSKQL